MRAQTEMLFFRWVTLTEHKWVIFVSAEVANAPFSE